MIVLVKGIVDPTWYEVREGELVLKEIKVLFPLWKIPKSFVSLEEVLRWLSETERKQAKNRAYRLLSMRSYSSVLLVQKLEEKGYSKFLCASIVNELQEQGYIQDEEFWKGYILREYQKGYGPRIIEWKGKAKGVPANEVRKLITEKMQREKIKLLAKKGFQALARRGFDAELLIEFFRT